MIDWARDHRVHHKYNETDADPHNAKRGFFFSHIGWLLCKKHPEVKEKGKGIDLSDLESNPILAFQKRYACRCQSEWCLFSDKRISKMNSGLFQILYHADAIAMLHFTHYHSGCVLERNVDECLLHSYRFSLYLHIEYDVASKLCGASLRQQTLW